MTIYGLIIVTQNLSPPKKKKKMQVKLRSRLFYFMGHLGPTFNNQNTHVVYEKE